MSTRPSLERLTKIHTAIVTRQYPNRPALAKLCGVESARTIQRDIDKLIEMHAPIAYSREHGGYYYTRDFSLLQATMQRDEQLALCMMEALVDVFRDTALADPLRNAFGAIRAQLSAADQALFDATCLPIYCRHEPRPTPHPELAVFYKGLLTAIRASHQVRLHYYEITKSADTERVVDPYLVFYGMGNWYLYGYCHLEERTADFALNRVKGVEQLDSAFDAPDPLAVRAKLAQRFGLIEGELLHVAIRFIPTAAAWIQERIWHPSQRFEGHPDGACTLYMDVEGLSSVVTWVLGFGGRAIPLAPPELVSEVHRCARKMFTQR